MTTRELHRGRLVDHIELVVKDVAASRRFYVAIFDVLGIPLGGDAADHFWADELFVCNVESKDSLGKLTGRVHLAFQAPNRETVERAYRAALAAGGRDFGAPGERAAYHPGYFAAFLLDPDGNNIEVVFHGPGERSADSVKVTY